MYQKTSNTQNMFKIPLDDNFMNQWLQYSLFQNNIYLRYIEIIIFKEKELRKYFLNQNVNETDEVKSNKKLIQNILQVKDKGFTDWHSIKDLVPELINHTNIEEFKNKYYQLIETPIISIDVFIMLFDEKIKQFITVNHIQDFIEVLYNNQDKIDNVQNLDRVNKKFNSIIFSYLEKMSTVLSKNNSEIMGQENINEKLTEVININQSTFRLHESIPTGFDSLDKIVFTGGGFQKSRFYLISGKTGFGKSQFVINLTKNFLKQGKTVLFITLENTLEETNDRLFSCITGLNLQELYTNPESQKNLIIDFFKTSNGLFLLEHIPQNSLTKQMIDTIIKIRIGQTNRKPDVIIIDYMDLMLYPEKLEERIRLQRLQNQMKQLQQETNTIVITPTQVNRQSYKEKDVDIDNIAESSGKANVQDSVLMLNGDKDLIKKGYVELYIQKNRHGKSFTKVLFQVDFDKMTFTDTGKSGYDVTEYQRELQGEESDDSDDSERKNKNKKDFW